ncbi:MAG: ATP-binding protein [Rhodospirillaceae bacterium]
MFGYKFTIVSADCKWPVMVSRGLEAIRVDRARLRQALVNLIANAAKFTENGWIEVRLRRSEGDHPGTIIEVEDNGPRINTDILPTIFDR